MGSRFIALLGAHGNAALFLTGYVPFVIGLAIYSPPLALVVGGGLLMMIAAWPFLWLKGLR